MIIVTTKFIPLSLDDKRIKGIVYESESARYMGRRFGLDISRVFEFEEHESGRGIKVQYEVANSYHYEHIDEDFDRFAKLIKGRRVGRKNQLTPS